MNTKMHLELTKPRIIAIEETGPNMTTFTFGPLPPGYAITVGNSLRRILLSSIPGWGIAYIKIDGHPHLYGTIEHCEQDIVTLVETLKQICFKVHSENVTSKELTVNVGEIMKQHKTTDQGQFTLTSSMIPDGNGIEILNDVQICTFNGPSDIKITLYLKSGTGYVDPNAIQRSHEGLPHGHIHVSSPINAVRRVVMTNPPEKTIHGEFTNYELLQFAVQTDGSITPIKAVHNAINIMFDVADSMRASTSAAEGGTLSREVHHEEMDVSKRPITELSLREPILNILKNAGITHIGQLCSMTKEEVMQIPKLGVTKIEMIEQALTKLGLTFSSSYNSNYGRRYT